jgi:hypothetical protein
MAMELAAAEYGAEFDKKLKENYKKFKQRKKGKENITPDDGKTKKSEREKLNSRKRLVFPCR